MTRSAQNSLATVEDFLKAVNTEKTAAEKAAKPLSEPGSIGGETTHPVKSVDDNLHKATEGARTAENTKDVKEDQGKPSVDSTPEAKAKAASATPESIFTSIGRFAKKADGAVSVPGSAADDHIQIGTNKQPTGEDPSNETNSAKSGKEDKKEGGRGGTTHPASTENDSLNGGKYAGAADWDLEKLAGAMSDLGNEILADVAWLGNTPKQASTSPAAPAATPAADTVKQAQIDPELAAQLGWEMAGLVTGQFDKKAADSLVHGTLRDVIKQASEDADLVVDWSNSYLQKRSEAPPAEETETPAAEGAGGPPPGPSGGMGGGGAGGGEAAMLSAMGGGGAPGAGAGGMGGGGMGGGGAGGHESELQALKAFIDQLGITPEELMQLMQEGGGDGGMPGAGAGGGAEMPPAGGGGGGAPGMEVAAADKAAAMLQAKNMIQELVSRSRNRK